MAETQSKTKSSTRGVVTITVVTLALFSVLFLIEFSRLSERKDTSKINPTLSADTYVAEVNALLETADATRGEAVLSKYECSACHIQGAGVIAPAFKGLAERAASRRPPLSAADYIYESIINPAIFLAPKNEKENYPNAMLPNYAERLSKQELGDMIAYLLTQ